ncbi:MAG: hypothetical protein KKB91_02570 [Proteobacteria bacterium]|nr:hypothetical protein [Pseudomonadota bacterium]MCG2745461.1 hypothetical protein [Desulfobacteraceae bacterium]MBU3983473.1 hypothetical protein [Pseudomonadota bacterium]MBU4030107.1 hypothetical protein [Pseudomonadota bacterium]MBU4041974.1 hypothetical protein [Pseudomonadota bacterium]
MVRSVIEDIGAEEKTLVVYDQAGDVLSPTSTEPLVHTIVEFLTGLSAVDELLLPRL